MNKTFNKFIVALLIASLFVFPMAGVNGGVQAQDSFPPELEPYLSADGLALYNAAPTLVIMVDPNPAMQGIKIPAPEMDKALADPAAAGATFSFTYVAPGDEDPWHQVCTTFPEDAKIAFNTAAAIWASTIHSSVPITIQACWASLSSPTTLGYSGGQPLRRDFSGAPQANTWYQGSLANALYGSDLDPTSSDMYITYNSNFAWYTGTDSNPNPGQYDLVTVAAHEIAHGLNFSGTARYSVGTGGYGIETYPTIYDKFMEDNGGTKLTTYTNPSTALGTLLTSGSLWFNGTNANAANTANDGTRVKMYAPSPWVGGSSYSHLDYSTFAGTANSMMVWAVSDGSANHNPGPVTTGLLKDLGWVLAGETTVSTIYLPLVLRAPASSPPGDFNKSAPATGATGQPANPTLSWSASSGATSYEYCIDTSNNNACDATWTSTVASTSVGLSGLTPATSYYWQVRANNTLGTTNADGGTWWTFTIAAGSPPGDFNKSAPANGATGQPANPTLSWGASSNATSYEYCIDTNSDNTCNSSWISTGTSASVGLSGLTPATSYYWQVRANNTLGTTNADGGSWWYFTIASVPSGPTAGFWESNTGDEFYVTPDQANVDDFAINIDVIGCGIYKITHLLVEPIVGNQFSFSGPFYASGTFDSTTSAHGIDGLTSFFIDGCGTVSDGPWSWTATWNNSSQPTIVIGGDAPSVILVPALQMPYYYHTITIKQ